MKKRTFIFLMIGFLISFASIANVDTTINIFIDTSNSSFKLVNTNNKEVFFSINYDSLDVVEINKKHPSKAFSFLVTPTYKNLNFKVVKDICDVKFIDRVMLAKMFFDKVKKLRVVNTYLKTREGWIIQKKHLSYIGPRDCQEE